MFSFSVIFFLDSWASDHRTPPLPVNPFSYELDLLPDHGINFLASPFITVSRGGPLAGVADVKMKRSSRILSSHARFSFAVKSKLPEGSKTLRANVPVQSEFTV